MALRFSRCLLATALLGLAAATTALASPQKAGEPFFPRAGNGGYDVSHYGVKLDYRPASGWLAATATIHARATQRLSRFGSTSTGSRSAPSASTAAPPPSPAAAASSRSGPSSRWPRAAPSPSPSNTTGARAG